MIIFVKCLENTPQPRKTITNVLKMEKRMLFTTSTSGRELPRLNKMKRQRKNEKATAEKEVKKMQIIKSLK